MLSEEAIEEIVTVRVTKLAPVVLYESNPAKDPHIAERYADHLRERFDKSITDSIRGAFPAECSPWPHNPGTIRLDIS